MPSTVYMSIPIGIETVLKEIICIPYSKPQSKRSSSQAQDILLSFLSIKQHLYGSVTGL